MRASFFSFVKKLRSFTEKQGFPIIVTVCVAVITATALWTRGRPQSAPVPTAPAENISAAQLMQQSLKNAATPAPAPTHTPVPFCPPLETYIVLQECTGNFVQSSVTGIWQTHQAADLSAFPGDLVRAVSDGIVLASGAGKLTGDWITIDHGGGLEILYSGVRADDRLSPGKLVHAGEIIGTISSGPMDESRLGAHLHLQAARDGIPLDPLALWDAAE